jgi:hypothetical protein
MTTNKIASWVASSVLEKDDPRRRAAIIKQFIVVAEVCLFYPVGNPMTGTDCQNSDAGRCTIIRQWQR